MFKNLRKKNDYMNAFYSSQAESDISTHVPSIKPTSPLKPSFIQNRTPSFFDRFKYKRNIDTQEECIDGDTTLFTLNDAIQKKTSIPMKRRRFIQNSSPSKAIVPEQSENPVNGEIIDEEIHIDDFTFEIFDDSPVIDEAPIVDIPPQSDRVQPLPQRQESEIYASPMSVYTTSTLCKPAPTLFQNVLGTSTRYTKPPTHNHADRRFPGPAGNLPPISDAEKRELFRMRLMPFTPMHIKESLMKKNTCMDSEYHSLWRTALQVYAYHGCMQACLYGEERIDRVCVLVKEVKQYDHGGLVVLQDEISVAEEVGVVHKLIIEYFVTLNAGTVLELVNVARIIPQKGIAYLNITHENVKSLIHPGDDVSVVPEFCIQPGKSKPVAHDLDDDLLGLEDVANLFDDFD